MADIFVSYTRSDRAGGEPLDPVAGGTDGAKRTSAFIARAGFEAIRPPPKTLFAPRRHLEPTFQETLRIAADAKSSYQLTQGTIPTKQKLGTPDVTLSNPQCPGSSNGVGSVRLPEASCSCVSVVNLCAEHLQAFPTFLPRTTPSTATNICTPWQIVKIGFLAS